MEIRTLTFHSAKLLKIILKSFKAPDTIAREYYTDKKYIGSHDRKFINEAVFFSLRNLFLCRFLSQKLASLSPLENEYNTTNQIIKVLDEVKIILTASNLLLRLNPPQSDFDFGSLYSLSSNSTDNHLELNRTTLLIFRGKEEELLESFNLQIEEFNKLFVNIDKLLTNISPNEVDFKMIETRFSVQSWILQYWFKNNINVSSIVDLCTSLNIPAKVNLRRNSYRFSRDEIILQLANAGIQSKSGDLSPDCIILEKRQPINHLDIFKSGIIEIQDEGSQLISFCLNPKKNKSVLDACAGAGGKTLHIASLQNDTGNILASDIEFGRLKEIKFRASRFGFTSINTMLLKRGKSINELKSRFDYVLVDAPCSGTGTVRRLPMPKLRLSESLLKKLSANQLNILESYSKCVKPGGELVYSTCSLMPEENQVVIKNFLERNSDFEPLPIKQSFDEHLIAIPGLNETDYMLTLFPHIHKTDGFFMAKMRRL